MVESAVSGLDNSVLIDNLSFKFRHGANYVQERRSVSFYASGSNTYDSNMGTKLIKLVVTSEGWLDPSTLRVMFAVNNTATSAGKFLRPLSGGHSFFQRLRILCGGTIVEDISDYNRVAEMFTTLISKYSKVNIDAEGFGFDPFSYKTSTAYDSINASAQTVFNFPGLPGGQSQTILFTPLSGLLSQPKWIALRYAPITIELELCKDKAEPFVLVGVAPFTPLNTSDEWSLSNVQIKCDILTLDNELEN